MQAFLKDNMGVIVISGLMFVIGVVVGIVCEEDERGIYISADYPNGGDFFTIGKAVLELSDLDFETLSEAESHTLIENIGKLSADNHIGAELREMAKSGSKPFERIPVDINLHFIDADNITGPVSQACKNSPIFKNPVVAYDLKDNSDSTLNVKGIMSLHAFWERQNLSDCESDNSGVYSIWVSKKHVESWIGTIDPQRTNILVKASIVVSSL